MKDINPNLTLDNSNLLKNDSKDEQMKEISQKDNVNNIEMEKLININDGLACPKFIEKKYIKELVKYLLLNNNKIKEVINRVELQIENTIKNNSINSLNIQFKDITKDLFMIIEEINKNNEIIFKLLNDKDNEINKNIKIISNDLNNKDKNKKLPDIKSKEIIKIKENNLPIDVIKSNHIMKTIFSFLNEGNKLKMIKYNKNFQNNMGIKLINYLKEYILNMNQRKKLKNTMEIQEI